MSEAKQALTSPIAALARSLTGLMLERGQGSDTRRRRLAGMVQGVVTSLGNKALSVLISFVSVPLTIGYLGPERFGAWVVIGSALAWLGLTDFGLGHGLTNAVTTAASQDRPDLVRMHLSNFVAVTTGIVLVIAPVIAIAWPFLDFPTLFGVHSAAAAHEVTVAMAISVILFLIRMPLGLSGRVYNAYQEGRIANYWGMSANILSFVCLLVVVRTGGGLPALTLALTGSGMLLDFVSMAWLFGRHRPAVRPGVRHVRLREVRQITQVGVQFFLISIMALITFQTDTIIIGHYLGAETVPKYSVAYSLFNYATLPQAMLFPYLWTAYNDAIARHDIAWVRRTFHLNVAIGVVGTTLVVLALLAICQPFIRWWVGPQVVPPIALAATIAVWVVINAFTNPIACLLAAASHLRYQVMYSALSTAANLGLSLYLVHRLGLVGVIGATVIAYSLFVCIPVYFDATFLLRRLERRQASGA